MKTISMRKLIAAIGAAALLSTAAVAIAPSAYAGPPTCTKASDGVETCTGTLSNGAGYLIKVPAKFGGTFFYWNHGIRFTYPLPGVIAVPKGVETLTPTSANTGLNVDTEMLRAGYGLATYDGVSTGGLRGWNSVDRVEMLKELIDTVRAKYTVRKGVIYGASQAGSIVIPFIEKYPTYADSVGIMAGVTPSIGQSIQSLCDAFYILSVFADPTIKGCAAMGVKGLAGHYAAAAEFGKVVALLTAWGGNLGAPGLEYPAALKGSGIPQRSALLLTGLLIGLPAKSAHMDGITTSAVVPEQSINATVAILENFGEAIATGTFGGQAISELTGPGFYDNTKTNWFSLLDPADSGRYNLGLSGDGAIAGMLGVLSMAPRVTGDPAAVAKLKALDKSKFDTTKPVVLLSNEADRLVFSGNQALYQDKARAVYDAKLAKYEAARDTAATSAERAAAAKLKPFFNVASLYAMTPETYTKYTAAGLPDFAAAIAPSGVGHESFTKKQTMAWVKILAHAADTGKVGSPGYLQQYIKRAPGLNSDLDYRPADLKYIW
jgi:alpha-beta hydrolase superfamily lysophospholipase